MFLVRHGHFWSCDKDGSHIIRSTVAENFMLHADYTVPSSIESELTQSFTLRKWEFSRFCTCDLDLDPMTFVYILDPYSSKIYAQTEK